ncbi:MAG: phospholipase/carboxylesterase [Mariniblastus sp.]|jgi:phospholipase/carboxylesterase
MSQPSQQTFGDLECVVVNHNPSSQPSAVVILCHGFGAPSTDLVSLADGFIAGNIKLRDVVFVFPAAPLELDPLFDARAWWMIDMEKIQQMMMDGETRQMRIESPELLPERRADLTRVIDLCRIEFKLPPEKIVVGGFSQGSMLATDVALHYDGNLGGLIIWSGALINESVWAPQAARRSSLQVVQSHGRIDPILPIGGAEDLHKMLTNAGHHVRYCEFPGQHSIPMESIELANQLIEEVALLPAS